MWRVLKTIKVELPYDPSIPLLDMALKENKNTNLKRYIHPIFVTAAAAAKSLQLCLTLCDPRDSTPPCSPVLGILQARILEWVAISFSNA